MDEELEKLLEEFLIANVDKYDSVEECANAFMNQYQEQLFEYDTVSEDPEINSAYALLEEAYEATTEEDAKELAKKAYALSSRCIEAGIMLSELEEDIMLKEQILLDLLEDEKSYLDNNSFFTAENIGSFYQILETRKYIMLLHATVDMYITLGKYNHAKQLCLEILRLNTNDNGGIRYTLMGLYAYFEEENNLLQLYQKERMPTLQSLFPLLVLYYKKSDYTKVDTYIEQIKEANPHFMKFIKTTQLEQDEYNREGYFSIGEPSEVEVVFQQLLFLITSCESVLEYLIQN